MNKWDIKKQRKIARSLVYSLTGKQLKRSKTGRPFVEKSIDVSVSHKDDFVSAAAVPAPYRIGIDLENLKARLNARCFLGTAITKAELPFFKNFCESNNFSYSLGIAVFWSIKESFFKCLDYDLKPGKISVLGISKKGAVQFLFSDEIKTLLIERGLKIHSANIIFLGKEYVFSQTIAKTIKI